VKEVRRKDAVLIWQLKCAFRAWYPHFKYQFAVARASTKQPSSERPAMNALPDTAESSRALQETGALIDAVRTRCPDTHRRELPELIALVREAKRALVPDPERKPER